MKCFCKVIGVCIVFAFFIMTNTKTSIVQNRQLKANKLHHYFNNLKTKDNSKVNLVEYKKFVKDSLSDIKNNSSNIRFVEVSEFTDSLLVRFITSDKVLHNYSAKFNSKKSKHIGTTYVSTQPADNFINNDLKKIISILELSLIHI